MKKFMKTLLQGAILTIVVLGIIGIVGNVILALASKCPVILSLVGLVFTIIIISKKMGME